MDKLVLSYVNIYKKIGNIIAELIVAAHLAFSIFGPVGVFNYTVIYEKKEYFLLLLGVFKCSVAYGRHLGRAIPGTVAPKLVDWCTTD